MLNISNRGTLLVFHSSTLKITITLILTPRKKPINLLQSLSARLRTQKEPIQINVMYTYNLQLNLEGLKKENYLHKSHSNNVPTDNPEPKLPPNIRKTNGSSKYRQEGHKPFTECRGCSADVSVL